MGYLLVSVILCLCFASLRSEDIPECDSNYFFNKIIGMCTPCLKCEGNEIIRGVCEGDKDTVCGPFVEFNRFQQSPINNLRPSKNLTLQWNDSMEKVVLSQQITNPTNTQVVSEDKKWHILAMCLLGVLSFVALSIGIYIVAVCFVCKTHGHDKEIIYDPEECTPVPPSPNNRTRLVAAFTPSRKKRRPYTKTGDMVPLHTIVIPVPLEDYDADNSGQTVSSTSTSHYVYFKTAEPPN